MSGAERAPHQSRLRSRFYELDPYGHVNHSVYIQYFESARVDLLGSIGMGLDTMLAKDLQLVVTRLATRFVGAAGLHANLTVETGLLETGRVRSTWAQRILEGDAVLTTQVIEFVVTNREGRPRRVPDELVDAMAPFAVASDWLGKHHPE